MATGTEGRSWSGAVATAVVRLRWLVVAAVAGAAYASVAYLPTLQVTGTGLASVTTFAGLPAAQAQRDVQRLFGLPLLGPVALVQHDSRGLASSTLVDAYEHAAAVDVPAAEGKPALGPVTAALPVPNSVDPAHPPTTLVTYLFGRSGQDAVGVVDAARSYGAGLGPDAAVVGVGGPVAVQVEQGQLVNGRLRWVELASVLVVALVVGLTLRSVVAPVVTLVSAGVSYLVAVRVVAAAASHFGVTAPSQITPLLVALTLGLATDYSMFFLTGFRQRLVSGAPPRPALRGAVAEQLPIVLTAGLTVAVSTATLLAARLGLFRAFGPGLAITVLTTLVVSTLLTPAALAILGRAALWPGPRGPGGGTRPYRPGDEVGQGPTGARTRLARWLARRPVAGLVLVVAVGALLAASSPLVGFNASVSSASSLPAHDPVSRATAAATTGFARGVLAPTELLVTGPGVAGDRSALVRLQQELNGRAAVAGVLGPAEQPGPLPRLPVGLFLAPGGNAARYLVVLRSDPLSAAGIADLRDLQASMPGLLDRAGLAGAGVEYAGQTALAASLVDVAQSDLVRVGILIAVVDLVLLAMFLRALVAPLYLLACSVLSVGAALGLTTWLFQGPAGHAGLVFYAVFAAAVLLVSLGSDYTIFTVGRIWEEARSRPLREALVVALPRSTRPVNSAGLALAGSVACVGLIPVSPFRELAFAMTAGILIDTFLVRSLLVPSAIVLVGRASMWPSRTRHQPAGPVEARRG